MRVTALSAATAVRAALSGAVQVQAGDLSTTYRFGPATASGVRGDHKPFFVYLPDGKSGYVRLEDLAATPAASDWDYNDRGWRVGVRQIGGTDGGGVTSFGGGSGGGGGGGGGTEPPYSPPPPPPPPTVTFPVTGLSTLYDMYDQSADVSWVITNPDEDTFHWKYTLTNYSIHNLPGPLLNKGVVSFAVGGAPSGFRNSTTTVPNWLSDAGGPSWVRDGNVSGIMPPDGTGTFEFKTDPQPIDWVEGMAGGGNRYPSLAVGMIMGPLAPPTVSVQVDKLIPANSNIDNFVRQTDAAGNVTNWGDAWVAGHPFIPKTRDFAVSGQMTIADPDLKPVTFTVVHSNAGTLTVSVTNPASGGAATLWKEQDKKGGQLGSVQLPAAAPGQTRTDTVIGYVEGTNPSLVRDDISLNANFFDGTVRVKAVPVTTAVTPVVLSTNVQIPTPSVTVRLLADPQNPRITLSTGQYQNVDSTSPLTAPGIVLEADTAVSTETIKYIQILIRSSNGVFGPNSPTDGLTFLPGSGLAGMNVLTRYGSEFRDVVDTSDAAYPFYLSPNPSGIVIAGSDHGVFRLTDTPYLAFPPAAPVESMNVRDEFVSYLVTTNSRDPSVFSAARVGWKVNFYGTTVNNKFEPRTPSGVYITDPWVVSHVDPYVTANPTTQFLQAQGWS